MSQTNFTPDPKALACAFNTQGHELSDEQLEILILHFRSERKRIAEDEAKGKKPSKAKAPAAAEALTIDDLLGDL